MNLRLEKKRERVCVSVRECACVSQCTEMPRKNGVPIAQPTGTDDSREGGREGGAQTSHASEGRVTAGGGHQPERESRRTMTATRGMRTVHKFHARRDRT